MLKADGLCRLEVIVASRSATLRTSASPLTSQDSDERVRGDDTDRDTAAASCLSCIKPLLSNRTAAIVARIRTASGFLSGTAREDLRKPNGHRRIGPGLEQTLMRGRHRRRPRRARLPDRIWRYHERTRAVQAPRTTGPMSAARGGGWARIPCCPFPRWSPEFLGVSPNYSGYGARGDPTFRGY
jgi:hypothetical protein